MPDPTTDPTPAPAHNPLNLRPLTQADVVDGYILGRTPAPASPAARPPTLAEQIPGVRGELLYRYATKPEDDVTGHDDMPAEYIVIAVPTAQSGIVAWGRYGSREGWEVNPSLRQLVVHLLGKLAALESERDAARAERDAISAIVGPGDVGARVRAVVDLVHEADRLLTAHHESDLMQFDGACPVCTYGGAQHYPDNFFGRVRAALTPAGPAPAATPDVWSKAFADALAVCGIRDFETLDSERRNGVLATAAMMAYERTQAKPAAPDAGEVGR